MDILDKITPCLAAYQSKNQRGILSLKSKFLDIMDYYSYNTPVEIREVLP